MNDRFCDECGVSKDLHYGDDDCFNAGQRARLIELWPAAVLRPDRAASIPPTKETPTNEGA